MRHTRGADRGWFSSVAWNADRPLQVNDRGQNRRVPFSQVPCPEFLHRTEQSQNVCSRNRLKASETTAHWQMIASSSRSSTRPSGGISQGRFLSHDDADGALKTGLIYTRPAQIDGRNTRPFTAGRPLYQRELVSGHRFRQRRLRLRELRGCARTSTIDADRHGGSLRSKVTRDRSMWLGCPTFDASWTRLPEPSHPRKNHQKSLAPPCVYSVRLRP
ncbi:hypothetical protein FKP32DRAFT_667260 [Trametes sanguinea]|nr:hypothetical protein FKP32DRAFT_667260 [Trametes sanguinea]